MIPLRDNNPTSSFPIVTILLIAINFCVFFLQPPYSKPLYEMIPADITSGHAYSGILHLGADGSAHFHPVPPEYLGSIPMDSQTDLPVLPTIQPVWLTIFTAMFLHANLLHIGGNMLFLWIFGNNVEDAMGKARFLLFYLGCGIVAAIAQIAADPHSFIPTLGASGAIAGVLGAYILIWPRARVLTLIFIFLRELPAFWVIGLWIALQVLNYHTSLSEQAVGGVAYMAHIGGFTAGVVATMLMGGRALAQGRKRVASYPAPRY